jgi:hypothetical protein
VSEEVELSEVELVELLSGDEDPDVELEVVSVLFPDVSLVDEESPDELVVELPSSPVVCA